MQNQSLLHIKGWRMRIRDELLSLLVFLRGWSFTGLGTRQRPQDRDGQDNDDVQTVVNARVECMCARGIEQREGHQRIVHNLYS